MQKQILPFLLTPLLLTFATHSMALTCSDDVAQNIIEANNYIFQLNSPSNTPTKGIKKEIRNSTTIRDEYNIPISTSKESREYDRNGLIIKSAFDVYSNDDELVYTERLKKTNAGWENIIDDIESKQHTIIKFITDKQGKVIKSREETKYPHTTTVDTTSYLYNENNCIMTQNIKSQTTEDTGETETEESQYTYQYKDNNLAKFLYSVDGSISGKYDYSYQYGINNRLISTKLVRTFNKNVSTTTTQFETFNDKNDWLSAHQQFGEWTSSKHVDIKRVVTYY